MAGSSTATGTGGGAPECVVDAECPQPPQECSVGVCSGGQCSVEPAQAGKLCNGLVDQCDGLGVCIDCVDNGGCGECCVCAGGVCIPA
jgi:hypothetical protein